MIIWYGNEIEGNMKNLVILLIYQYKSFVKMNQV